MNGLMKIFRLFLRIDSRLEQIVDLLVLLEKHHQAGVSPVSGLWLDNQDVMQKLHISESTLKRRRLDGTIRSVRIKGKYYYREADL
ncbi:MAG: helix-turn-helix domain-containing protein, partial [Bacteroidota bacterium]|nr:helix-turn-helix domain-containing protein [Bacteroidota bacterium]